MSSLLNVSYANHKPEEFSIKDMEMLVDNEGENWFKRANVGKFLGLTKTFTSAKGLSAQKNAPKR